MAYNVCLSTLGDFLKLQIRNVINLSKVINNNQNCYGATKNSQEEEMKIKTSFILSFLLIRFETKAAHLSQLNLSLYQAKYQNFVLLHSHIIEMSKCLYHAWTKEEEKKLLQLAESNGHKWKELQRNYFPYLSSYSIKNKFRQIKSLYSQTPESQKSQLRLKAELNLTTENTYEVVKPVSENISGVSSYCQQQSDQLSVQFQIIAEQLRIIEQL
ncbi:SANT/Myb_domain [Hexamita inflata]|uniref:SANT/Myb domain n=1 Tax=Hexamita inflata TaxID=28002 RepID=A0AA86QXX5_9EUKA|nr:SANT/Myb domain [Hexamita inflata]